MPITVVDFEEKKYIIADAEFKLKKPTLGIKRRGAALTSILVLKLQELSAISNNYLQNVKEVNTTPTVEDSSYTELYKVVERINKLSEEVFTKAEELFKIILEPVNPEDNDKLIADNIDENIVTQIVQDFFQLAGLSITPAKN